MNAEDRESLEWAAQAAGITGTWQDWPISGLIGSAIGDMDIPWNPLCNDGQALRLAVRCAQLFGFYRFLRAWLVAMATEDGNPADPYAATRRAIVRAAAEIGKAMV